MFVVAITLQYLFTLMKHIIHFHPKSLTDTFVTKSIFGVQWIKDKWWYKFFIDLTEYQDARYKNWDNGAFYQGHLKCNKLGSQLLPTQEEVNKNKSALIRCIITIVLFSFFTMHFFGTFSRQNKGIAKHNKETFFQLKRWKRGFLKQWP